MSILINMRILLIFFIRYAMSIFLYYYEKKNPLADWRLFKKKQPSFQETAVNFFPKIGMVVSPATIIASNHEIKCSILSDGVSSDVLLKNFKKGIFQLSEFLCELIRLRTKDTGIASFVLVHLVQAVEIQEVQLSDLSDIPIPISQLHTYKFSLEQIYKFSTNLASSEESVGKCSWPN